MRALRRFFWVLYTVVGVLMFSSVPALAAALEEPETKAATVVTGTTAMLNGVLNPKAPGEKGEYEFDFAASATECVNGGVAPEPPGEASGKQKETVSVTLTDLSPDRPYTFCVVALHEGQSRTGVPLTLNTLALKPAVDSESAPAVMSSGAVLEAFVNPNDQETYAYFQYSTSATVDGSGSLTGATQMPIPPGTSLGEAYEERSAGPVGLSGLTAGVTYYYQVVASNAKGTTNGPVQSFTTVPTPHTDAVSAVTATTATFNGHLTLTGVDTSYSFSYNAGAECAGGGSTPVVDAGSGAGNVSLSTAVSDLLPRTTYTVCLVASNAFGSEQGPPITVTTAIAQPTIDSESVTEVTASSAKLDAEVSPGGAETTYRFEYGATEAYGQSTTESPSIGSDDGGHAAIVLVQELSAGTTYHYRVVATNQVETVDGPDETFTTQGVPGAGAVLPDGRQWELVSPVEKSGSQIFPTYDAVIEATEDGSAIAYYATGPFGPAPAGNLDLSPALSRRGPGGWSTEDIATPHELSALPNNTGSQSEDVFFSSDLAHSIVEPSIGVARATDKTLYLRDNSTGAYTPLITAANTLPGTSLTKEEEGGLFPFVTATNDLSHVVLRSPQRLTSQGGAELTTSDHYYEWSGGQLQFINEPPAGTPETAFSSIGGMDYQDSNNGSRRNAISENGSRIFWTAGSTEVLAEKKALYMHDMLTGKRVWVNAPQEGVPAPAHNEPEFQLASSDGSRAFFTDPAQLTTAPGGGLYEYEVESGKLSLLTISRNAGESADVEGFVIGASEDDSYMYFVATGVLSENQTTHGEKAAAGADNLYMLHSEVRNGALEWKASFIAALSAEDKPDWAPENFDDLTARVSPNGRFLTFMSDSSLTGYDNADANSGQRDEEVYLYDAQSEKLTCASCDPTGARPVGHQHTFEGTSSLPDLNSVWMERWVAATLPEWVAYNGDEALYQPRYLSNSGRLFFDSPDALVPRDTNGTEDVYEYEPEAVGDCTGSGATYSGKAGGCVSLISGGKGEQESVFADASASGDDVFFVTSERLVSSDVDNAYDLYDAHVCSAEVPCAGSGAVLPPACDTADSCKAPPSVQPSIFGSPASATFSGAGNPAPVLSKVEPRKARSLTRAQKLTKALSVCRKRDAAHRGKRSVCEKRARRLYGRARRAESGPDNAQKRSK